MWSVIVTVNMTEGNELELFFAGVSNINSLIEDITKKYPDYTALVIVLAAQ